MRELQINILRVLRSERFFKAILALFVLESAWIAISAAYPMVFDENTHFGVIQLYADRWNPVWTQQPPGTGWAGPLTALPSYMYQYLMSFPYRLVAGATESLMAQIIVLRFINIALFGLGLVLFRRLLLRTRVSPAIVHATLLFFILTPVVPLLAGQINYDNLLFPLTALVLLMAISVSEQLRRRGQLPVGLSLQLLTACMLTSLVQFAFLPIFAAATLWLGWQVWRQAKKRPMKWRRHFADAWRRSHWQRRLLIGLPLVVAGFLFVEMYGTNIIRYHNPTPACHQVLSERDCSQYGGWQRNQEALANKTAVDANPLLYGAGWTYRMFVALFYTSSGGASPQAWYLSVNPLPVAFAVALAVCLVGAGLLVRYHRLIFSRYKYLGFLLFVSAFYVVLLWSRNYHDYLHVGQKIAINGRYLFPVALPLMLAVALAYRQLFAQKHHLKTGLMVAVLVLLLQGGGALTYIAVSNPSWYWQNRVVISLNRSAQRVVKPLIIFKTPLKSIERSG